MACGTYQLDKALFQLPIVTVSFGNILGAFKTKKENGYVASIFTYRYCKMGDMFSKNFVSQILTNVKVIRVRMVHRVLMESMDILVTVCQDLLDHCVKRVCQFIFIYLFYLFIYFIYLFILIYLCQVIS